MSRRYGYVKTAEAKAKRFPWVLALGGAGVAAVGAFFALREPVSEAIAAATRTPDDILRAVAKVDPEHNPILQPGYYGVGTTACNFFIAMVTKELGCPIPQLLANDQADWVAAGNDGWYPTTKAGAQSAALMGQVAVAMWHNLGGHGHASLVLPYPGAMMIAQAGRTNFNLGTLAQGWGSIQPAFYAHS